MNPIHIDHNIDTARLIIHGNYDIILKKEIELEIMYEKDVLIINNVYNKSIILTKFKKEENDTSHVLSIEPFRGIYQVYPFLLNISEKTGEEILNNMNRTYYGLIASVERIACFKPDNVIIVITKEDKLYYINYYMLKDTNNLITKDLLEKTSLKYNKDKNLLKHIKDTFDNKITHNRHCYKKEIIKINENYNELNLFNYQIDDLKWMKYVENLTEINISVNKNPLLIQIKGGSLISEMGTGKTITVLSHIVNETNDYDKYIEKYNTDRCNYFYKKGNLKNKNCRKIIKSSNANDNTIINKIYCKEHSSRSFIDKIAYDLKEDTPLLVEYYLNNENQIHTNSNIIICPSHLGEQWCLEYYNKILNKEKMNTIKKRVILILTREQYWNLTIKDVLYSDIIILSNELMMYLNCHPKNTENISIFESIEKVSLSTFKYKRIFLDEIHQYTIHHSLKSKCDYIWNITGTPLSNKTNGFCKLIQNNINIISLSDQENLLIYDLDEKTIKQIVDNTKIIFKKNTKQTVEKDKVVNKKGNAFLPSMSSIIKYVEFTTFERNIYESYIQGSINKYSPFIIKLCCDPELSKEIKEIIINCKNLEEFQEKILNKMKTDISLKEELKDQLKSSIIVVDNELNNELNNELDNVNNDELNNENNFTLELKKELKQLRTELSIVIKNIENIKKSYNYLKDSIDKIENNKNEAALDNDIIECIICMDKIEEYVVTKCGHMYCKECIEELIKIKQKHRRINTIECSYCSTELSIDLDITNITDKIVPVKEVGLLDRLIDLTKSSKIANIINDIRIMCEDTSIQKIIIFSQWNELLVKINKYINIRSFTCKGSVYQKTNAIKNFQNSKENSIIFLSSANAASGINLTNANNIIFVEPILGNKDYRKDIENQAIGRAVRIGNKNNIQIQKYIIKNTIEEDILNNAIDDDQLKLIT